MDDEQLLRYSRQILLPQVGIEGQERLRDSHALVVGVGGLGGPAALYLAAAGVGRLTIADPDRVELSNLQRQIALRTADLGRPKVEAARATLRALNPLVEVRALADRLAGAALRACVADADVVLDASDNFATRFDVNCACVDTGTPLVSGAAIRMEGQVAVFHARRGAGPCYRCLYMEQGTEEETCSETGVFAPLVGVIGSLQAAEALRILTGAAAPLQDRLLVVDLAHAQWRTLRIARDPGCPVCGEPG
ncbi:molybdopterin-synthase adenylyltransferase [bacterium BMS3Bbin12]|nr:molybdopterin-synthase adenylyltransferase [bacterium BMS3Abin12]GBE47924.1 molybdopterin-synthase adenylyltransferase [bacterium BMS3Bbin12]GBE50402.1 molybdopterin-synthase adenylyltransferase [bacterium BMS3Bbin13]HDO33955.1 molybdopterin-synthase adenylyltransferase MoeB [Chromatiales bacterium]